MLRKITKRKEIKMRREKVNIKFPKISSRNRFFLWGCCMYDFVCPTLWCVPHHTRSPEGPGALGTALASEVQAVPRTGLPFYFL